MNRKLPSVDDRTVYESISVPTSLEIKVLGKYHRPKYFIDTSYKDDPVNNILEAFKNYGVKFNGHGIDCSRSKEEDYYFVILRIGGKIYDLDLTFKSLIGTLNIESVSVECNTYECCKLCKRECERD